MSTNDASNSIDVDLTRSAGGVWLVKMPKYLSQILSDHADGTITGEVGHLIQSLPSASRGSTAVGPRSQDVVFRLTDQIMGKLKEKNRSKDYKIPPQEHRFCLNNVSDGILRTVYTRTSNNSKSSSNEQISLIGKVIKRADVRPVENEQYMSMKRKHFEMSQEPTRKAVKIDKKINPYTPKRNHAENIKRDKARKLAGKRVRSDEDVVLNRMFEAFAKNQYISMSGLEGITAQPKNYLQQLVKKYCNYNNAGHTYELKPQFRHYSAPKEQDDDEMEDDDDDDD
jgi:transcription initiation factor TFIIF subunit beta